MINADVTGSVHSELQHDDFIRVGCIFAKVTAPIGHFGEFGYLESPNFCANYLTGFAISSGLGAMQPKNDSTYLV